VGRVADADISVFVTDLAAREGNHAAMAKEPQRDFARSSVDVEPGDMPVVTTIVRAPAFARRAGAMTDQIDACGYRPDE